jgi:hypothetical protein
MNTSKHIERRRAIYDTCYELAVSRYLAIRELYVIHQVPKAEQKIPTNTDKSACIRNVETLDERVFANHCANRFRVNREGAPHHALVTLVLVVLALAAGSWSIMLAVWGTTP